jgi:FkbM family methyltransferase
MATKEEMFSHALQHHRAGRLSEADLFYRQILSDWPDHAEALHLFGVLAAQLGQHAAAAQLIARAIELQPQQGDFHASFGNVLYLQGDLTGGARAYKVAMYHDYIKHMPFAFSEILERATKPRRTSHAPGPQTDLSLYRSLTLQDLFLDRWIFREFRGGTFIDVGAHDGMTHSNTYFFEKARSWGGVCVEPHPIVYKRLLANRTCRTLNCCVSERSGSVEFRKITGFAEMLSGIVGKHTQEHKERLESDLKEHGGSSEIILTPARTINEIAAEQGLSDVTYLSIDTVGGELGILQSIDFSKFFVHAVTAEGNVRQPRAIIESMQARNFELIKTLGADFLFLNRKSRFYSPYDELRNA